MCCSLSGLAFRFIFYRDRRSESLLDEPGFFFGRYPDESPDFDHGNLALKNPTPHASYCHAQHRCELIHFEKCGHQCLPRCTVMDGLRLCKWKKPREISTLERSP